MERQFLSPTVAERVAAVELAYYRQANHIVITAAEMLGWYHTLSPEHQTKARWIGVVNWKRLTSLKRYSLEKRSYKLQLYMALYLSPPDLLYWVDLVKQRPEGLV